MTAESVLRGIYFSVVTISSLGYGDIHPLGAAKFLAGFEVLIGLAFVGIVIAKLTSKPLTHLVSRLFASETKRQLDDFKRLFETRTSDFKRVLEEVRRVYQSTPSQTPGQPAGTSKESTGQPPSAPADPQFVQMSLRQSLDRLSDASTGLHDYIREEGLHRSYFALAPTPSFLQLAEAIEEAFFFLGQSMVALPLAPGSLTRTEVLTFANRRAIDGIISMQRGTCEMIVSGVRIDERVQNAFERISGICDNIKGALLPIPEQPDQLMRAS